MKAYRMTEAKVIETARGIVTGELLVADLSKREWRDGLMLIISGVEPDREGTIGLILVPRGPHTKGYWTNGVAPTVVWECSFVHVNDLNRLGLIVAGMQSALYPEQTEKGTP